MMSSCRNILKTIFAIAFCLSPTFGFVSPQRIDEARIRSQSLRFNKGVPFYQAQSLREVHPSLYRQRRSISNIQTQGLFGLGGPEIAIIVIVGAFIIGPEKLGQFAGEFKSGLDDVPEELRKIPEEFQKGVEEGEINARARNAKQMNSPPTLKGSDD